MPKIAVIENSLVANILEAGDDWKTAFPEAVAAEDGVKIGYSWDGTTFTAPARAALSAADLLAYAATKRWQVETGGIKVFGIALKTGRDDRTLLYEAEATAKAESTAMTTWIAADGTAHVVGAETVIALAAAVRAHVAACFATYSMLAGEIAAAVVTTTAGIDAAAWPANS